MTRGLACESCNWPATILISAHKLQGQYSLDIHWKHWPWSANPLVTWCEEPTHWKSPWRWARLEREEVGAWQRMRWLDGIADSMDKSFSKVWEMVKEGQGSLMCCSPWVSKGRPDWATQQQHTLQVRELRTGELRGPAGLPVTSGGWAHPLPVLNLGASASKLAPSCRPAPPRVKAATCAPGPHSSAVLRLPGRTGTRAW